MRRDDWFERDIRWLNDVISHHPHVQKQMQQMLLCLGDSFRFSGYCDWSRIIQCPHHYASTSVASECISCPSEVGNTNLWHFWQRCSLQKRGGCWLCPLKPAAMNRAVKTLIKEGAFVWYSGVVLPKTCHWNFIKNGGDHPAVGIFAVPSLIIMWTSSYV